MSDYTEADLDRELGITSWGAYDKALKGITEGTGGSEWAEFDAELERIKEGRTWQADLLDKSLGINVSEAEQAEAKRQLAVLTEAELSEAMPPVRGSKAPPRTTVTERKSRPTGVRHVGVDEIRLANGDVVNLSEIDRPLRKRSGTVTVSETTQHPWRR